MYISEAPLKRSRLTLRQVASQGKRLRNAKNVEVCSKLPRQKI